MASFLINTRAELLKSRRTLAYRACLIAGAALPVLYTLGYIIKPGSFMKSLSTSPWVSHIDNSWQMGAACFPLFLTMITSLVVQTEYRNNTWKVVYTQPRSYADIFFSKFVVVQLLLLSSLLMYNLSILLTGYISNTFVSGYAFFKTPPPFADMLNISGRIYIASLCITAIQYWISLRFKNYMTSIGIGIMLTVVSMIVLNWDKSVYFPYGYPLLTYFRVKNVQGLATHEIYSLIGTVVVLLLGFLSIVKKKEHG